MLTWVENRFAYQKRAITEAMQQLRQSSSSSALVIWVIAIAFAFPALLKLATLNVMQLSSNWDRAISYSVLVDKAASKADEQRLLSDIRRLTDVAYANFISAEEGLKALEAETGMSEVLTMLQDNPLPSVIEVFPKTHTKGKLQALQQTLAQNPKVESVEQDALWLQRVQSLGQFIHYLTIGLVLMLCVAVFSIVGNTLRMVINQKRQQVEVLQFLGATDGFILGPFIYLGIIYGAIGALFAWGVVDLMAFALAPMVSDIATLYFSQFVMSGLPFVYGLTMVILAATLGGLAAFLTSRYHIRQITV